MKIVEKFQTSNPASWYRGVGNSTYTLSPTLFRHPKKTTIEEIQPLEIELASIFEQRSPPFVAQSFKGDWEQMFFMQHYGIPTRLLDWTESPFIALYFALASCDRTREGEPIHDAVFWLLNPSSWNKGALQDITYSGGILNPNREQVKSYSPKGDLTDRKNLPVMIYGTHNSPRIVAQRGMFALFGKSLEPMEESYRSGNFEKGILQQIMIPKGSRDEIASSLFRKGVSDSTIYPDLHGLSMELKRSLGFTQ
jgi:hypothetical protein